MAGIASALFFTGAAAAADHPDYRPAPAWVLAQPIKTDARTDDGAATQVLLQNEQYRLGADADEYFVETATKVATPSGLESLGSVTINWSPDNETLAIHAIRIVRGTRTIDILGQGEKVSVLRRESGLEELKLDGSLTATLQVAGLEVGDILDVAYTIRRQDPVRHGHSDGITGIFRPGLVSRAYIRLIWPKSKDVKWRATRGLPAPVQSTVGDTVELLSTADDVSVPKVEDSAPARFKNVGTLDFSDFPSWAEVSAVMAPYYAKAADLSPTSPIRAEAAQIRARYPDPEARALAALQLVEDKVRYFFIGMDNGGYIPAGADLTWSRRFGDCKGKTVLLIALLHELGIQAEPALVSTWGGDGMEARLPTLDLFDHVIVRASIGDHSYWLDATRLGDYRLKLEELDYAHALPLRPGGAGLVEVAHIPPSELAFESRLNLDATGGLDRPAPAHVEHIFRGETGLGTGLAYASTSKIDVEPKLKDYWKKQYSWIKPEKVSYTFDRLTGQTALVMDGAATIDWAESNGAREFIVGDSGVGWNANFQREAGPDEKAPLAINYDYFKRWTVVVKLPHDGARFGLANAAPIDKTVAGFAITRRTEQKDDVVTIVAEERALTPEISADEAQAAAKALRTLADFDVIIRAVPPISAADKGAADAALAALNQVIEKAQTDSSATSILAGIQPVVSMPGFAKLSPDVRRRAWSILSWAARQTDDFRLALSAADEAVASGPLNARTLQLKLDALAGLGESDAAARTLATYARALPNQLDQIPDSFIGRAVGDASGATKLDLCAALFAARWVPTGAFNSPDFVWLAYAEALLERGDADTALKVAREINVPRQMIMMRADKRFDRIVASDPQHFDVKRALAWELADLQDRSARNPDLLEGVNAVAQALVERSQPEAALALVNTALARARSTEHASTPFKDQDEELRWTLNAQADALRAVGQTDDAIRALERSAHRPEHGHVNVSQILNLAITLVNVDRAKDALDVLQDIDPGRASPFGMMTYKSVSACANAQLGDMAKAKFDIGYLRDHAKDSPRILRESYLCVDDSDAAAANLIAALDDTSTRSATLRLVQRFTPPAHAGRWETLMLRRERALTQRRDVSDKISAMGRVEDYPIHRSE